MQKLYTVLIILLMAAGISFAGTIYIWTDEDGVRRFSDQPPPAGIENYETAEGSVSKTDEGMRPGLEKMIKDVEREGKESEAQKKAQAEARAAEKKMEEREKRNAPLKAERAQLQKQIHDLEKRAVSIYFTQGMREHQINELQKQIDELDRKINSQ